jgi:hypothetical protein
MTYKADWVTGDILTAAQQNALAEQAISRFADASARNAAITSPTEGQACWLNDTNELQIYDGSSWKPLLDTDTFSVSSGNYTITTDLTVSGDVTIQTLDMDTIVEGDVIYGSGADTLARLAKGSDDEVLTLASGVPSWAAASAGVTWSGSTANGIGTYGSASSVVAESTATYDGTTLELTTAGGGLKLDDLDSADANTLDFYEEGTFTATLTLGSGTAAFSSGEDLCAYTRVGRVVHISGNCGVASVSTPSGICYVSGLPFTSADLAEGAGYTNSSSSVSSLGTATTNYQAVCGTVIEASTTMLLRAQNGGTAMQNIGALLQGGSYVHVGGSYIAA